MGSYEIDQENYLNYTGDGWVRTTKPLTQEEIDKFNKGELGFDDFEWE